MRIIDTLALANQAPLADRSQIRQRLGLVANALLSLLGLGLALAALHLPGEGAHLAILGAVPGIQSVIMWPMIQRRGLHTTQLRSEPRGLFMWAFGLVLSAGIAYTIHETLHGQHPAYLLQFLALPLMLDMIRKDVLLVDIDAKIAELRALVDMAGPVHPSEAGVFRHKMARAA